MNNETQDSKKEERKSTSIPRDDNQVLNKHRPQNILYSKRQWIVPQSWKTSFVVFALILLASLIGYSVEKRTTMQRLAMDSVLEPIALQGELDLEMKFTSLQDDQQQSFTNFKGQWVFLNLWATWCPPCRDEMPALEMLQRRLGSQLKIVALSVDEDVSEVSRFFGDDAASFEVWLDPERHVSKTLGVTKFPESFLINPEGKIVAQYVGPKDWYSVGSVAYFEGVTNRTRTPTPNL